MVTTTSSAAPAQHHGDDTPYYFVPDADEQAAKVQGYGWMKPIIIDDDDLMFGGKSLSTWYEEERQSLSISVEEERRGRQRGRSELQHPNPWEGDTRFPYIPRTALALIGQNTAGGILRRVDTSDPTHGVVPRRHHVAVTLLLESSGPVVSLARDAAPLLAALANNNNNNNSNGLDLTSRHGGRGPRGGVLRKACVVHKLHAGGRAVCPAVPYRGGGAHRRKGSWERLVGSDVRR
ncbi:hypothetical protein DL767_002543 [Monosporascus sp. MG133]|nr:hypothetical protein DL767_002543 [Monosporascus sp. MG133]